MRNSTKISMCTGTFDFRSLVNDTSDHGMLDIRDVAHALARARKFPDPFDGFYSVAQHNVLMTCRVNTLVCFFNGSDILYILGNDFPGSHLDLWMEHKTEMFGYPVERLALLHGADRAYLDNAPSWLPDDARTMMGERLREKIYRKWTGSGQILDLNVSFLRAVNLLIEWVNDEILSWARHEFLGIKSSFKTVRDVKIETWSQERAEKDFLDRAKSFRLQMD